MHQFVIGRMSDWQLGGLDISFSKAAAFMFAAVTVATLFLVLTTSRLWFRDAGNPSLNSGTNSSPT